MTITIDEVFLAADALSLGYSGNAQPGYWRMVCPLCVANTEGEPLTVTCGEPAAGSNDGVMPARLDCRSGCDRGEIERTLRNALAAPALTGPRITSVTAADVEPEQVQWGHAVRMEWPDERCERGTGRGGAAGGRARL